MIFNFVDLRTTSQNNNCTTSDFVEIRESNSTGIILSVIFNEVLAFDSSLVVLLVNFFFILIGRLLGKYCGSRLPEPMQTADNVAYVRFRTQQSSITSKFKLNFNISIEGRVSFYEHTNPVDRADTRVGL